MFRYRNHPITAAMAVVILLLGCSGTRGALEPAAQDEPVPAKAAESGHQLWGFFHVHIDPASMQAETTPLRNAMFTCNVLRFMQPPVAPHNMVSISVQSGSDPGNGYFVVNVSLQHPFPGWFIYNGFDVRGIFMANGSISGQHDSSVLRAGPSDSRVLNPDGYTRFWNPTEFTTYGTLFGFTKCKMNPDAMPSSTVNPYKYFADGLGPDSPVQDLDPAARGIFRAGNTNTRRYEIQFKMNGGKPVFDFAYAVDASWSLPDPSYAPDYPPEAFDISANVQEPYFAKASDAGSTAYYVSPTKKGGTLKFNLEVFDRQANAIPGGVPAQISAIWLESTVLNSPVNVLPAATALPGSSSVSSVFQFELSDLNLTSAGTVQLFATIESSNPATYEPAVPGGSAYAYPAAPLAGYFTFEGTISSVAPDTWPTDPVLIDPDHPVVATHFAIDHNGIIHALYQNSKNVYWSYSSDKGNTWINKGAIYTAEDGIYMFRTEIGMTSSSNYVYCVLSAWDGESGTTYCRLTVGRLNASNLNAGWEFKLLWEHTDGYSADQCYSGLQIAVDGSGNIMVYAMIYNFASFVSRYTYVPGWDALTGAPELTISPVNGYLVYYYPQPTVELVADSQGRFFMVAGGNYNDYDNYNGTGHDFGCFMLRYDPGPGTWRFVQSISNPGGSFYWNSWAAGLATGADDTLYWVNGYQHDNCGYYGLQGGYFVLSYGTGSSSGNHDFYYDDPINDYHNCYAECDLTYEYYGYDLMFVSSSIGVDPSNGSVVIVYQRSMNYCHVMAIRNDGSGWSDPPVQIDGGLLGQNPYGRMHPSGWFLVTFTDTNYKNEGSGLPYFVAWK